MESSIVALSKYRLDCAKDDLETAELNYKAGKYRSSVNRSYYAIFHTLRALTALDNFDSSKHSGIIAFVNKNYVKEGIFDKSLSKMIDTAFRLREKADYQDFYIVSKKEVEEQIEKAKEVIAMIEPYLKDKWKNIS